MKKTLTVLGLSAALCTGLVSPASANALDLSGALATTAIDVSDATLANSRQSSTDPNTTCKVNAAGNVLVQRTNAVVAEVYAQDLIAGVGECLSLSSGTYSGTLTIAAQYYVPTTALTGTWKTFYATSTSGSSTAGVLTRTATATVTMPFPSAALGRYHRGVATLTNSRGQRFVDITPVWYVSP